LKTGERSHLHGCGSAFDTMRSHLPDLRGYGMSQPAATHRHIRANILRLTKQVTEI